MIKPKSPAVIRPGEDPSAYKKEAFLIDLARYKAFLCTKDGAPIPECTPDRDKAKLGRNEIINRILVEIELNYREYEASFFRKRAIFEVGSDVVELGLSTSATVVGAETVKAMLAAALSGVQGTRISITKNYFRDRTVEVLITAMRASRDQKRNDIRRKAQFPVAEYPFEEAWADLVELFYFGTLQGAIQTLAASSGDKQADADADAQQLTKERELRILGEVPQAAVDDLTAISKKLQELAAGNNLAAARAALQKLEISFQENAAITELLDLLNKEMDTNKNNSDRLKAIRAALGIPRPE